MSVKPLRIAQLSDLHILADPQATLLGVNTRDSFKAVVDVLQAEKDAYDMILLSGDLSQDGSVASYAYIAEILRPLAVPVYTVPGNHDDAKNMATVYPCDPIQKARNIKDKNWQLILLDSQKPNAVPGYLAQEQLEFLQKCLTQNPEQHAMVVFHHQPCFVGSEWLDQLGLTNASELWHVLAQQRQVRAILFGHVHQAFAQEYQSIKCYAVPSTCIQFKTNVKHFALEKIPPGYRWVHLYPDGHIETGIHRISQYIGDFDHAAKGY